MDCRLWAVDSRLWAVGSVHGAVNITATNVHCSFQRRSEGEKERCGISWRMLQNKEAEKQVRNELLKYR